MSEKIRIHQELALLDEYWSQKVVAKSNGQLYKVAKGIGETRWHCHDDQDELFIVYQGCLTIQLRDKYIELNEGEMFVVPKGVEHCPKADEEVRFIVVGSEITSNEAGGKPDWSNSSRVES